MEFHQVSLRRLFLQELLFSRLLLLQLKMEMYNA
jgi:hypothetical protein